MIVQHNIPALTASNKLAFNNKALSKNLEKLSSGYRINRAADDASGLAISEKMRAQITGLDAATLNCQDGISMVQVADGAMQETQTLMNRMVDIVTRAANGVYTSDQLADFQDELDELILEIERVGVTTKFNTLGVLDGSLSGRLQIGASSNAADTLDITFATAFTAMFTAAGMDVTKGVTAQGLGLANMSGGSGNNEWQSLIKLDKTATQNATNRAYIDKLTKAIDVVSSVRSKFGAWQNRLEHTVNNLTNVSENLSEAESRIRDVDMAKEMMAYTKNSILSQSAQAMLSQAMQQPQNVLNLLN